jgi:putative oxidoreductase
MALVGHRVPIRQWAALPLRLIVGYGFIVHGYAKVMNGPERFAASLHASPCWLKTRARMAGS